MLKVGIIGLGVGERHIGCFESHSNCSVVSLCDLNPEKLNEVALRHPGRKLTVNPDEVLEDPEVDIVSIASYDNVHFEQCKRGILGGKHIFVEKPLCLYEEEAKELRQLLNDHPHLRISSNHVLRVSSRFQELKREIENGIYGELYYLEGDYQYGRLSKIVEGWRGKIPFYSVVYGGGVHVVDLLLWLSGERVVEVFAYGNQISSAGTDFKYNDMVVALLKMSSGLVAKVSANFGCKRPHFHSIEVHGTERLFVNRPGPAEIWNSTDSEIKPILIDTPYRDYQKPDLIVSFLDSILDRGKAIVGVEDIFEVMSVCFAIEKSAGCGKPVTVNRI